MPSAAAILLILFHMFCFAPSGASQNMAFEQTPSAVQLCVEKGEDETLEPLR